MLIVGANAGIIGMSKEHLAIAIALGVPIIICMTKVRQTFNWLSQRRIVDNTSRLIPLPNKLRRRVSPTSGKLFKAEV